MTFTDELSRDLKLTVSLADLHAEPVEKVTARATRTHRRRAGSVLALAAAAVVVTLVTIGALPGSPGQQSAQAGEVPDDTYVLSEFSVEYPYQAAPGAPIHAGEAGVSFTASWASDKLPGLAQCQLFALDEEGGVVGELSFEGEYTTPTAQAAALAVPVSEPPAGARGYCALGSGASGAGYEFVVSDMESTDEGSVIHATANWAQSEDPGWRSCQLTVTKTDGTEETDAMGVSVPDGTTFALRSAVTSGLVHSAAIECQDPAA